MTQITDPAININIANAIAMCKPDAVFINTGSEDDREFIRAMALAKGEEAPLPMQGHTIHFDLKDEQGRIIDRTYYIANPDEKISSLANRMERPEALEEIRQIMSGIMRGKTMVVGFYMRGPGGVSGFKPCPGNHQFRLCVPQCRNSIPQRLCPFQ